MTYTLDLRQVQAPIKDRYRTDPATALVVSSMDQRFDRDAASHEEGAHAFRRIGFMACDRQKIDAKSIDIGRNLADRLSRIAMKQAAAIVSNAMTSG